jgi:very-short-patch-repair endonuclease
MLGYDFDRQKPINNYIVDFFCNELMLAIEIDGISHDYKVVEDEMRQSKLESLGIRFLRFNDSDVKENIEGVVTSIRNWILEHTVSYSLPTPGPSQEGKPTPGPSKEGSLGVTHP